MLPYLTCRATSLKMRGQIYNSRVRGTMLYSSECWALRQGHKECLEHIEGVMLLWMCSIKKEHRDSTNSLLSQSKLKTWIRC